jgi:hypothetical protein
MKASEPDLLGSAEPRAETVTADHSRIYEKLAVAVESESLRSWLERVRVLLNARSASLFPAGEKPLIEQGVSTGTANPRIALPRDDIFQKGAAATAVPELGANGWRIAIPIQRDGAICAILAIEGNFQNRREVQAATVALQVAVGWVLYGDQRSTSVRLSRVLERSSDLLLLIQRTGVEGNPEVAVRVTVDGLCDYLQCDRVYLGWTHGSKIRLEATSGVSRVDPLSIRARPVEAAMREALKAGHQIDYQLDSTTGPTTVAHALLLRETGAARLSSVPLAEERGALLLQWNQPTTADTGTLIRKSKIFLPISINFLTKREIRLMPATLVMERSKCRMQCNA